jgi:hypothetical protein
MGRQPMVARWLGAVWAGDLTALRGREREKAAEMPLERGDHLEQHSEDAASRVGVVGMNQGETSSRMPHNASSSW